MIRLGAVKLRAIRDGGDFVKSLNRFKMIGIIVGGIDAESASAPWSPHHGKEPPQIADVVAGGQTVEMAAYTPGANDQTGEGALGRRDAQLLIRINARLG